jgi:uncharacterized repeat protein (TIGR01451 family)
MFRKIVSNIPFQPALLGQTSFYLNRLRKEESLRRVGFIMISLVLLLQIFSLIYPSKPSLATSANDIIYGASSKDEVLRAYTNNRDGLGRTDIRAIFNHYGIASDQISSAKAQKIGSKQKNFISTGRSTSPGNNTFINIPGVSNGGIFQRPLSNWDANGQQNYYDTITGMSKLGFRFWIIIDGCGNIVFEQGSLPPNLDISKQRTSGDTVYSGGKINYQIQFRNVGPGLARDVRIKDILPDEFSYVSYTSNIDLKFSKNGNVLVWRIANSGSELTPSHKWYTIKLHLKAKDVTSNQKVCNTANISANGVTTKVVNDSQSDRCVKIQPPVLMCQSLSISEIPTWDSRKFETTISTKGKTAVPKQIDYYVNNNLVASIPVADGSKTQYFTYKFPTEGTYEIFANLIATNGVVLSSGEKCRISETINKPTNPEPMISTDKMVSNITQNISNANNTLAKPGDKLKYTIFIYNKGEAPAVNLVLDGEYGESINDILEYSDLIDKGDANFDNQTNFLSWSSVTIPAGSHVQKSFIVQVKNPLPNTPTSASDPLSYDFKMQNVYGREVIINLDKPPTKLIEQSISTLPNTGPGSNLAIIFVVISVVGYFFYRNKLLAEELEIVHHEYSKGNI